MTGAEGVFGAVLVFSVPVWMSYRSCQFPVPVLMSYRTYRSVPYLYDNLYLYRWYRYPCLTELAEVSGTGIDASPNLPKCPVPVLMLCRNYRSGMKVSTSTGGTGIHMAPNLPKCQVPELMSYRTYRSVQYRY